MRLIIWLCILSISLNLCFGQKEIDSLRFLLTKQSDAKATLAITSDLAWQFYRTSEFDSAAWYYRKSISLIAPDTKPEFQSSIYYGLGSTYNAAGKLDSAISYYKSALRISTRNIDSVSVSGIEANLSIVYKNQGLYEEALKSALNAVSILEKHTVTLSLASCYNTIGSILMKTGNYNDALVYYKKATKVLLAINEIAIAARTYNNIGELFILTHQYDSASINLQRAAKIKRELNDTKGLARTLSNMGKVSFLTGNMLSAEKQLQEALVIEKNIDDPIGMIEVLNNLGEFSITNKELTQARRYLLESESIIRKAGTPEYLRQNLELQIRLDRERRDFASGMLHLEQLLQIRDSLLNEDKSRSLQAMQIRYETEKKEQQIAILEQREEINQVRIRNNQVLIGTLILGLIFLASIGTLAYINLRNARAARQRFELLLAETRHRIKNNLQTLASIFNLQTKHYTDHNMIMEARSSESRLHAMSLLHQNFYSVNADHTLETRTYVTDLVNQLINIYGFRTRELNLVLDVDQVHLDIDKAVALGLIIHEVVCNSFKYAFDNISHPQLEVDIKLEGDRELVTTISDNGVGLNHKSPSGAHGLGLVEALVDQLNGKIRILTEKGVTFIIRFPITPLWKGHSYL